MIAFKPAAIFGNHMVVCRDKELRIFGQAEDGTVITATLQGKKGVAKASNGRFLVLLPPLAAATDAVLSLSDGNTTYQYTDVAIGDVFLAGGQSNMELALENANEGERCIKDHEDSLLRFYRVPVSGVWDDEAKQKESETRWQMVAPNECGDVSAAAYFFAQKVREEENVPVGIVECYLGGTMISCWLDEMALCQTPQGKACLEAFDETNRMGKEAYDLAYEKYIIDHPAWEKRAEEIKTEQPDIDWVKLNELAGQCPWPPPMGYRSPYRPNGLAQTMLDRIVPYTLTGILYYQGESDDKQPDDYHALLMTLVLHWRHLFMDAHLPFMSVQLPMYGCDGKPDGDQWARIRLAQTRVNQSLRHCGLAITIDRGDEKDVHPTDKRVIGERLYQQARQLVYGKTGLNAPEVTAKYTVNDTLVAAFSQPLVCLDAEPRLFEIADERGIYQRAKACITGGSVSLSAEGIAYPTCVRYAYVNWGIVNVFGENGLPLAPFVME